MGGGRMFLLDPISFKILKYLNQRRKSLIINRKYAEKEDVQPDDAYLASVNELKKLLTNYSKSSVNVSIRFLINNDYIEQKFGDQSDWTKLLATPDKKALAISNRGYSSLYGHYLILFFLILFAVSAICFILLVLVLIICLVHY